MAHSHYVMDLYFPPVGRSNTPRHEALRIVADDDDAAVLEAKRINVWRKPETFGVRAIRTSARSGDRVIYTSPAATEALPDEPLTSSDAAVSA